MVGLVVVSHSSRLAEGVVELAREMGGATVAIEAAGGVEAGGALGTAGVALPAVEFSIAVSVIALGLIVAFALAPAPALAAAIVGLFAIFHGHAHGTEMPLEASGAAYAAGFMLATGLLHVAGIALGLSAARMSEHHGRLAYKLGGGAMAVAGVGILLGM